MTLQSNDRYITSASTLTAAVSSKVWRVLSNLSPLDGQTGPQGQFQVVRNSLRRIGDIWLALKTLRKTPCDAIIAYEPHGCFFLLCALKACGILGHPRIIVVDLILPNPSSKFGARLKRYFMANFLKQVDGYLLHIKDTSRLAQTYGIPEDRVRYIPYKVNNLEKILKLQCDEKQYIFTGGRSRRDYSTYSSAMREAGLPGVLLASADDVNAANDTYLDVKQLPANVTLVRDNGSVNSWLAHMAKAKIVVVPIDPDTISAAGVGTYLVAMALGKCVIITDSPATRGILSHEDQALIVPARNATALRQAIERAWNDDVYRRAIAERGRRYALSLGSQQSLIHNIADQVDALLCPKYEPWSMSGAGSA